MSECVRFKSRMALVLGGSCGTSVGAGGLNSQEGEAWSPLWPFSMTLLPGKQVGGQRGHSNSRCPLYHERASERHGRRAMILHEGEDDCLWMTYSLWTWLTVHGGHGDVGGGGWVVCLLRRAACLHSFCEQVGENIHESMSIKSDTGKSATVCNLAANSSER